MFIEKRAIKVADALSISSLVPPQAGQNWKLELFELTGEIPAHYHKLQRQFILVTKGVLAVLCHQQEPLILKSGQFVQIEPTTVHALVAEKHAQFLVLDLPGFEYPEDVYEGKSTDLFRGQVFLQALCCRLRNSILVPGSNKMAISL